MDHFNAYTKSSNVSSFIPIKTNERSSAVSYGDGYVYTGPSTVQYHESQSKYTSEVSKHATRNDDEQNPPVFSSPSTSNLSLSSSPSSEVVSTTIQYQFKVMLLGDSGVGKLGCLIYV